MTIYMVKSYLETIVKIQEENMFNKHFSEIKKTQLIAIITGMMNSIGAVLSAFMIQKIVDAVTSKELHLIKDLSIKFVILLVVYLIVSFVFQYYLRIIIQTGSFQIRKNLFSNQLYLKEMWI